MKTVYNEQWGLWEVDGHPVRARTAAEAERVYAARQLLEARDD